jgi:hypothetical protein
MNDIKANGVYKITNNVFAKYMYYKLKCTSLLFSAHKNLPVGIGLRY